ncbi:conserved hypothetical protein [Verticillium alfalfae VaMs.102]|uniref:Peroxisome membrane anchor protein Pex14p N-terminal domain-containing protein n=1 Tax=Verticillium alfalfae (strain VaMs.102 / ATCC MYA-4576 / FGSC 10136) TaxID=526221 RepID=C9SGP7_VERA1|nr:conserved hypothetical protein [Verticillium alfalfae VaMs.102]EEY17542.1 conserved hypothetical protein [Verticillium alfalfae VaMs.102]
MGDSDEDKSSGIPSWQKRDQSEQPSSESSSAAQDPSSDSSPIEVARRFLQDDEIKDASRERKLEFLKTKGLEEADIEKLLGPADTTTTAATPAPDQEPPQPAETPAAPTPQASAAPQSSIAQDFHDENDTGSEAEDPTELFTATSASRPRCPRPPAGPSTRAPLPPPPRLPPHPEAHARRLADLTASLRGLKDAYVTQSEELADVKTAMDLLKDDLGQLTFPSAQQQSDFVGGFSLYGSSAGRKEPEDEIKKAKDNIRRVKGVMLSTRNFPTSSR